MSFVPPRTLKRIFPPMVTGTVILLIGASLIGSSGIPKGTTNGVHNGFAGRLVDQRANGRVTVW